MLCPACKNKSAANAKFCTECGAALTVSQPGTKEDRAARSSSDAVEVPAEKPSNQIGERRYLTALFCDLVGSTEIAARLDPEEWSEIALEYQREASLAVERFGGHVAKFLGDGILIYFGWPHAHDNDAERGVRAGLALLESVAALNIRLRQSKRPELSVRVGIHSGQALVGEGERDAVDIFGDTPNLAAGIQAAAEPGMVVMTAATGTWSVDGSFWRIWARGSFMASPNRSTSAE